MSDELLFSPEFADDAMFSAVAQGQATISQGAKNDSVVALQKALMALGITLKPDGSFGPKTRDALADWQKSAGLSESGVLDAETLMTMDRLLVERRKNSLHDAMARAVGMNPAPIARPAPVPRTPPRAEVPNDAAYFIDGNELPVVGNAAADDPDFPPPAVDQIKPLVAAGTPLAADRREMFSRIRDTLGEDAAANAAFSRILATGRFHSGKLLPNLATLATTKRHPELMLEGGIDADLLVRQVVRHVDNPLRVQQGMGRGTCGAGVIEYLLLRHDLSEFVRLIDGITGFSGEAKLRSGRTITMPRTAIPRDKTGRVDIDRLFQSTIMNHATIMSWLFDYDNPADDESFWAAVKGSSQMPIWGFAQVYEDILGQTRSSISRVSQSPEELMDAVAVEAARGNRVPVILQFSSLHWLNVEWVVRGADGRPASWVLRNPWGWDEADGDPPREPMPEGGGRVRMKTADFMNALFAAVVNPR
jgi:peptidoglycan hydrolase-like protein with peptidoglycan-binding domain